MVAGIALLALALRRPGIARPGARFSTAPAVGAVTAVLLFRAPAT
jgi:hypothetical protein